MSGVIGGVGALVTVYLRWTSVLPRFKNFLEIDQLEEDYANLRKALNEKLKTGVSITDAEAKYANELRDDIRHMKMTGFSGWAVLYVIIGSVFATVFVGSEVKGITDTAAIVKLMSAGAFWTSFLSLLDVKVADNMAQGIRRKIDEGSAETIKKLENEAKAQIASAEAKVNDKLKETIDKCNDTLKEVTGRYNADIEKITGEYNTLVEDYNELLEKYNKATR